MQIIKQTPQKKTVYEIVTERVIEQLKNGNIMWRKSWKASAPCNYISGHRYQGINFMLLNGVRTTPYWLTRKQLMTAGGSFKPGEENKPHIIVFWMFIERDVENKRNHKIEKKKIPFLKYFSVYNYDQCDGLPVKEMIPVTSHDPIDKCEQIIKNTGADIIYYNGDKAYYSINDDHIKMPDKKYFKEVENFYSVAFHELTHWTGAKHRLNREGIVREVFDETDSKNSYNFEELVAEFGAAFLCAETGIDNEFTLENSAAYIANWIGSLEKNPMWLVRASTRAQKASKYIMSGGKIETKHEDELQEDETS